VSVKKLKTEKAGRKNERIQKSLETKKKKLKRGKSGERQAKGKRKVNREEFAWEGITPRLGGER